MSAKENKKLIQDIFQDVALGNGASFVEHLHDDVTLTITGDYSWSQTFEGKESVLRDLYGYVAQRAPSTRKTVPFRFLADDDWVVVEARGEMTTQKGEKYANHYCLLYRLEAGMIVEMREYQDSQMCERILGPFPKK